VAEAWNNMAFVLEARGRYDAAEKCLIQVVAIYENFYGKNHPNVSVALANLAAYYYDRDKFYQALPLYRRAIAINEILYGSAHQSLLPLLDGVVACYERLGEGTEGTVYRVRARKIRAVSR